MSGPILVVTVTMALLAIGLVFVETGGRDPRAIAVIAALAAAATAGRLLFVALPSVKPVTVIVLVTGATLGPRAGFAVGALTPLLSNMALGQGTWTPGQMLLWGAAGVVGALLGRVCRDPRGLAVVAFAWGYVFGWGMNLWDMAVLGPAFNTETFLARAGTSLWFDTAHAVGNVAFALAIGAGLVRLLSRYRSRITTEIVWVGGPLAAEPDGGPVSRRVRGSV